jgi:hypothetical protein
MDPELRALLLDILNDEQAQHLPSVTRWRIRKALAGELHEATA